MPWTRRITLLFLCTAITLCLAGTGCDPKKIGADAENSSTRPSPPSPGDTSDGSVLLPIDTTLVDAAGGTFTFLDGQIVLEVPEGAFESPIELTVERTTVSVDGVDLVGYIWGPYGKPIDPVARVTVRAALSDVLAVANDPEEAGLYALYEGLLGPLDNLSVSTSEETVAFSADLGVLETIVIAAPSAAEEPPSE